MSKGIGRGERWGLHGWAVHTSTAHVLKTQTSAAHVWSAEGLTALAVAAMVLGAGAAHAVALPPPPVSPAPVTDYEYDAKGNLTKVIKAKGVSGFGLTTQNAYDTLDRVKTSTDPKSGVTSLGYDGQDNLSQVTDPRSLVTQYQRSGLGDVTQLSSPDTGTANSTYDAAGNLLTRTDSRGVLATYTYEVLSRPSTASYTQAGQTTVNYGWTYDQSGGVFGYGIGRLTTATFPAGNTQYGYDAHGRVITSIQTVGTVALTTRYAYDGVGHVTSITYPSGRQVVFTWQGGQLTDVQLSQASTPITAPLLTEIQWQAFGPARSWKFEMASGTKSYERVFDQYGRLVRYPLNNVVRDLTYDAANRITSYSHLDAASGLATTATQALGQTFGYDELGRLTTVSTAAQSWTIGYDANGNRTNVTLNGASRDFTTATTSNRLNQISNPTRSFSYDAAGNTTADSTLYSAATYATDNRLTAITKAGVTTTYTYDAGGQRVMKVTGGTPAATRLFVYDQGGQLLGEYDASGTPVQEFVWMGSLPVVVMNGSAADPEILYVYADHLGAPRVLVDNTGAERWRWISEPFGSTAADPAPTGRAAVEYNPRFPGQYFDKETGLNYNYFRDYDSTTGRYVQSDPIGLDGGLNTYAYVNSSALLYSDPTGHFAIAGEVIIGGTVIAIGCAITPACRDALKNLQHHADNSGSNSNSRSEPTTVEEFCSRCKATASRAGAQAAAYVWAGVTPTNGTPTPWSDFNPPGGSSFKRGPVWADFFRNNSAPNFGGYSSVGRVEEHPFGHPDIPGGLNHDCPHFVATNAKGETVEFPYRPGS